MKPLFEVLGAVPSGTGLPDADLRQIVRQRQLFNTVRPGEAERRCSGDGMGIDLDAFDLPVPIGAMPLEPEPRVSAGRAAGIARERMPLETPARAGKQHMPVDPPGRQDRAGPVPEAPEPDGFQAPRLSDLDNRAWPLRNHTARRR